MATANWRGANLWPKPYVQPRKKNEEDGKSNKEQIGKTDAIELEKCRFVEDKALEKAEQKAITLFEFQVLWGQLKDCKTDRILTTTQNIVQLQTLRFDTKNIY